MKNFCVDTASTCVGCFKRIAYRILNHRQINTNPYKIKEVRLRTTCCAFHIVIRKILIDTFTLTQPLSGGYILASENNCVKKGQKP